MEEAGQKQNDSELPRRRFPRIPLVTPLELRAAGFRGLGQTANLSQGGMLAACERVAGPSTQLHVLFNLPTGHSISASAEVVHARSDAMGMRFMELAPAAERALSAFIGKVLRSNRRSVRIPRRFYVTIRSASRREPSEELAETVLLSRHGGLLVCRAPFKAGERIIVWWPDQRKSAEARIVFRVLGGVAGLVELAFEFENEENFWAMEFPPDTPLWRHRLEP